MDTGRHLCLCNHLIVYAFIFGTPLAFKRVNQNDKEAGMSNKLKKIKARNKNKKQPEKTMLEIERVIVTTEAGTFIGEPRSESGWMTLESYSLNGRMPLEAALQKSCCGETGEVFVKPFDGRYQTLSDDDLRKMIGKIESIFARAGVQVGISPEVPLWMQAEYLENTLDFEIDPPCGCKSSLRERAITA